MCYRDQYVPVEGVVDDVFCSEQYQKLCQQNIIIDDIDTGWKYFQDEHDVAYGLLGDGVSIFDQGHELSETCWAIILQNLNLPPEEHCKLGCRHENIAMGMQPMHFLHNYCLK